MPSGIHRRVTHGKSAPAITPATPAGSRARPRPRDRHRAHRALMTARHLARRRRRQAQPCIASASQQPHGRGSWPGDSRHVPRDRQDQTTGRTVPIAASLTLAALLRPLIPAARAGRRQAGAPGQWLPPCPRGHQDLPPAPPGLRPPSCPARAEVYGPPGRVGPKYLPGRARLAAPVLAVRPPGGPAQGLLGRRRRPSRHQQPPAEASRAVQLPLLPYPGPQPCRHQQLARHHQRGRAGYLH
jgi:hypothetical protein